MQLRETDTPLIQSVFQYKLTFNEPAQRQVFPADKFASHADALKATGEALSALARAGYLKDQHEGKRLMLPGGRKYYILGEKASTIVGPLSGTATKPPGPQALALNLGVLWFCSMKRRHAQRLSRQKLESVLPDASALANNVVHCVRQESDSLVLYRIYLATGRDPRRSAEQVVKHLETALEHKGSRRMVHSGEYGIAVLAPTGEASKGIREAVAQTLKQNDVTASLGVVPRITVEPTPVPETLGLALGEYKRALSRQTANGNSVIEPHKQVSGNKQ